MSKHVRIATPDIVNPMSAGFAPMHRSDTHLDERGLDVLNPGTLCQLVNDIGEDVDSVLIHKNGQDGFSSAIPVGYEGALALLIEDSGVNTGEGVPIVILRGFGLQ